MNHRSQSSDTDPAERGMALVTVLAITLLMAVLILSFFSMSLTERRSAESFSAGLEADHLAQSGINLAIGILREGMGETATTEAGEVIPLPYTTQPGALRVHQPDGSLRALYKLYSSDRQIAHDVSEALRDVPEDWSGHPLDYVDMNEPAVTTDPLKPTSLSAATLRFPIVDPRQYGRTSQDSVEGFSYPAHERNVAGLVGPSASESRQRLPMPVRWLYLLADGTFGVLGKNGTFHAVRGTGKPSRANPVRGRLAFWTDDESTKINVNTASEGVFWDTPRATTKEEMALGLYQPAAGEYHRFPGHPAGVCLSSVLFPGRRFQAAESTAGARLDGTVLEMMPVEVAERLWQLSPVLNGQLEMTSRGGWQVVPGLDVSEPMPALADLTPRLTTPSDLLWTPLEVASAESPTALIGERAIDPLFAAHPDAARRLERGAFFLTSTSHAPETTLFGTPRVSIWPLHANIIPGQGESTPIYNKRGSMHDYMTSLSTTLNGRRYYWSRAEPANGSSNFQKGGVGDNKRLFNYTRALTSRPVPGFTRLGLASSFADKYGPGERDDRDNILLSIFDYIRQINLNDGELTDAQQFPVVCPEDPKLGFGQVAPLYAGGKPNDSKVKQLNRNDLFAARGQGRIATISEVSFLITCRAEGMEDGTVRGEPSSLFVSEVLKHKPGAKELEMAVIVEGFVPSQGWGEYRPYMALSLGGKPTSPLEAVTALPNMTLQQRPLDLLFEDKSQNNQPLGYHTVTTSQKMSSQWMSYGGSLGPRFSITEIDDREFMGRENTGNEIARGDYEWLNSAFLFKPVLSLMGKHSSLLFSGAMKGTSPLLQLAVYDTPSKNTEADKLEISDLMQTIPLSVPSILSLPQPDLPTDGAAFTLEKRLDSARAGGRLISSNDIVQSLVPAHGDYRLIAASRTLDRPPGAPDPVYDAQVFVPHPLYGRARQAHSLTEQLPGAREAVLGIAPDTPAPGTNEGSSYGLGYFPDLPVPAALAPDYPWQPYVKNNQEVRIAPNGARDFFTNESIFYSGRLDGGARGPAAPHLTGDFDNGLASTPDGPYINRADDGEVTGYANHGTPYFDVSPPKPMDLPPPRPRIWGAQRQLPSPVMLGSLPTGVKARVPWQTLLFRPQRDPEPTTWSPETDHYGWSWPRDHLLLDLFWMPVQEPAALSHAFATQGKINLNHRLVPFDYIERTTALHAAMKAEKLLAIPDEASRTYKLPAGSEPRHQSFRHFIDPVETLKQWDHEIFDRGDVFLTASQICEHYLVPEGLPGDRESLASFWKKHRLTGDNSRERPYANLYGRFTTRSNVFRVHVIAEALRLPPPDRNGVINTLGMEVVARQEGSALVERQLDPRDSGLPDYVLALGQNNVLPPSLDNFYTWRVRAFDRFDR